MQDYDKLSDIAEKVTQIHTILRADKEVNAIEALEGRVSTLETWRSYLAGAWAVIMALFVIHATGKH